VVEAISIPQSQGVVYVVNKVLAAIATAEMLLAFSVRGDAEPLHCTMPTPANVRVDISDARIRVSTEITLEEMRQAAAGRHSGPIVGAYRLTIKYAVDIDGTVQEIGQGHYYCLTPQYIILRVKLEKTVFVPHEFASDDCLSTLSLEHERKHAQAQDQALENLQPRLVSALSSLIGRNPRDATASGAEALEAFTKEVQSEVEHLLDKIDEERAQFNAAVDTPDELDRLRYACDGRALRD
jgi:hypothetical protein